MEKFKGGKEVDVMKKGFTLLELITVVIIIAILAVIALPQFFMTAEKARSSEATHILGVIRSAQLRYYAEHSANYTKNLNDLDVDINTGNLKYFSAPTPAENSASIQRKGKGEQNGAGSSIGQYTLKIDYNTGNITCTNDPQAPNTCKKLGF